MWGQGHVQNKIPICNKLPIRIPGSLAVRKQVSGNAKFIFPSD